MRAAPQHYGRQLRNVELLRLQPAKVHRPMLRKNMIGSHAALLIGRKLEATRPYIHDVGSILDSALSEWIALRKKAHFFPTS